MNRSWSGRRGRARDRLGLDRRSLLGRRVGLGLLAATGGGRDRRGGVIRGGLRHLGIQKGGRGQHRKNGDLHNDLLHDLLHLSPIAAKPSGVTARCPLQHQDADGRETERRVSACRVRLRPGHPLLLYTDGLIEAGRQRPHSVRIGWPNSRCSPSWIEVFPSDDSSLNPLSRPSMLLTARPTHQDRCNNCGESTDPAHLTGLHRLAREAPWRPGSAG